MRISASLLSQYQRDSVLASRIINKPPVIRVDNGTFYRSYPSFKGPENPANPSMFPGLTFSLPSSSAEPEHWAVSGSSSSGKTTLVEAPLDHTRSRSPSQAIKYVGFGAEDGSMGRSRLRGAYLSARYESRREDADFSVLDYLKGNTELNPSEEGREQRFDDESLNRVIENLRLGALISMPLSNLSNGQTRRARIAKALLGRPEVLLLDEPFSRIQNLIFHALQADQFSSGSRPINFDHSVTFTAKTCPNPVTTTHTCAEATRSSPGLDHPPYSHRT